MSAPRKWDGQRETLDDLSDAVNYNHWIYGILKPYLGNRILEIGCGTGNLTGYFAKHGKVLAVDMHPGYLAAARERLKKNNRVSYKKVDLEKDLNSLAPFKPDTIVCVNVLEHLEKDRKVLERCLRLLPPGGRFLVFVPALPWLFGTMDESYGHYRRYTLPELNEKIAAAGFKVDYCRYLNLLGVLGWWWNGKVLKRKIIPKAQILIYDWIVQFSGKVERFLPKPLGVSLFAVGRKPDAGRKK